ncbi:serpin family protein [Nocardiopsis lambiniae]|uniref:Serpin family protein n=1 Tax=Nocardiopsis lambiniae TaxID=3075539 RepID=A0ABU2MAB7_9ACTN|nr:serpin family protein [Nocardiopsis sp. DSM 44743]MDT0329610.1 serpin family protein [Nocardiopsis sp. DSM 44743]
MSTIPRLRRDHLEFAAPVDRELIHPGASHVWSPHSVGTVLALLASGSSHRTLAEIVSLIGRDFAGQLADLDASVGPTDGLDLAVLNGLYTPADLPLRRTFVEHVRARGGTEVANVDFRGDSEGVRRYINGRVAQVTHGLIDQLLPPGLPPPDVRLLLVNALWVRVAWQEPFKLSQTGPRPFRAPGGTRPVPTMHRTAKLPLARAHGWSMVTLTGRHGLYLDILLPDVASPTPPPLAPGLLAALHRGASPTMTRLALPRFTVRTSVSLLGPLARLGLKEMVTDRARFDAISAEPLKVSEILHQAVLSVDEKGAEGAAATGVMMLRGSVLPSRSVEFTVDRPFVLALRRASSLLFLGRVTDPVDPGPAS